MSFSLARTVAAGARKISGLNKAILSGQTLSRSAVLQGRGLQTLSRSFTRSNWVLCKNTSQITENVGWTRTCGCCGMHTQGDQDLVNFLDEEIKEEKKMEKKLGVVKGFEISSDGAEVVFTKKIDNQTITITLNVNNSVDDESGGDAEQDASQAEVKMVCRPPFLVEISKGGQVCLGLQCAFPPSESYDNTVQGEEQYGVDLIEIQEVALYSGNWGDKIYSVEGPVMDGNLYDMLLNMLEERGVDADFVDQMVDYCTGYEHQRYVGFLQSLKDFAGSK